jgi:hypothetical protein
MKLNLQTYDLVKELNLFFQSKVRMSRVRMGEQQEIETLISEEALLFGGEIEYQIRLENISEVYPNTKMFTNLTEMKIKMKDGQESSLVFKSGDMGLALGGVGYASQNARTMTDRYVGAINKLLNAQTSTAFGGKMFCRYCGEKNEDDAVFCKKCGKKIAQ